ncbi:MAG: hypothetical protein HOL66_12190 [Rhodospirillaceae bacterium]|nr:hypothetical protein [Rhodospirillaceae bacterium]MBT5244991.1 hypothetical protein [Rhodospirillaceae bacterium]MBT5561123.1 hypothetical protein [Rhodospirillaceae bacterium]MBT6240992.1 hypothetical protein [Rhodospirillaceae bacterium]
MVELHYTAGRAVRVVAIDPVTGTEVTMVGDAKRSEAELKRLAANKLMYVLNKKKNAEKPEGDLF